MLTCSVLIALTISSGPAVAPMQREHGAGAEAIVSPASIAHAARLTPAPNAGPAPELWMTDRSDSRPAALTAMYASLAGLNALDVYSTRRAIDAGAREANPLMNRASGSTGTMLALKALSTAGTVFFAERAWKKSRKGTIVLMAVLNGVTAAVTARNLRHASR